MMPETFAHQIKVLFQHCDPAGIVFYPRYFEMVNQSVEKCQECGLDCSFSKIHLASGHGVPTVSIEAEFTAPSHMGDVLTWTLQVNKLGRTSAHLEIEAHCGTELRMRAEPVLVYVNMATGRPVPWPEEIRTPMSRYLSD